MANNEMFHGRQGRFSLIPTLRSRKNAMRYLQSFVSMAKNRFPLIKIRSFSIIRSSSTGPILLISNVRVPVLPTEVVAHLPDFLPWYCLASFFRAPDRLSLERKDPSGQSQSSSSDFAPGTYAKLAMYFPDRNSFQSKSS